MLTDDTGDDPVGLMLVSIARARCLPPWERLRELRMLAVLQRCIAAPETWCEREIQELIMKTREEAKAASIVQDSRLRFERRWGRES